MQPIHLTAPNNEKLILEAIQKAIPKFSDNIQRITQKQFQKIPHKAFEIHERIEKIQTLNNRITINLNKTCFEKITDALFMVVAISLSVALVAGAIFTLAIGNSIGFGLAVSYLVLGKLLLSFENKNEIQELQVPSDFSVIALGPILIPFYVFFKKNDRMEQMCMNLIGQLQELMFVNENSLWSFFNNLDSLKLFNTFQDNIGFKIFSLENAIKFEEAKASSNPVEVQDNISHYNQAINDTKEALVRLTALRNFFIQFPPKPISESQSL
jgi:hypothetical protein